MPSKPFSVVYDHWVRLNECIFGADSEKPPCSWSLGWISQSVFACVYVCVSHLTVEQPVKWVNEYTGSIFHFLFGALTVAMLFLWAVRNNELFQVAIWSWQSVAQEEKRWVGDGQTPIYHGGLVQSERREGGKGDNKYWIGKKRREKRKTWKREKREEVLEMRQRAKERRRRSEKGEPGCRGALPAVCVVHAFQPGGSKPGKGRAHTHTHTHSYVHTHILYTMIPKGETFIEHKNTLYTHFLHRV